MDPEHCTQEEEPHTQELDQPEHAPPWHGRSRPPCTLPPSPAAPLHTGGRGGITQGVSFEFFESFLLIYSHNTH